MTERDLSPARPAAAAASPNGRAAEFGDPAARPTGGPRDGPSRVPIRGVAARLVSNMTASLEVPTATTFRDVSAAVLERERSRLNRALAPRRLSFTHLIAYAVAQAAAVHPAMAAHFEEVDGTPYRVEAGRIGLGLAVDVEGHDGSRFLVVPVVRGADELDFAAFVAAYDDLVERARTGALRADDLAGGTISLTNPGTLGTTASVPRLVKGQGAIVATGSIRRTAGEPAMTISSTYDHRIIQGAESGRFLRTIDELLQGADDFYGYAAACLGVELPALEAAPAAGRDDGRQAAGAERLQDVASAAALVRAYRQVGHLAARLDPLGSEPPGDPSLDPAFWGLSPEAMADVPAGVLRVFAPGETLAELLPNLQAIYCGASAFEVEHISSHQERTWLRRAIESGDYRASRSAEGRRHLLERLTAVEALETFLGRAYLGQKRFSIEGLDVLVPMLDELLELVGAAGAQAVEIGTAHRGRLNMLAHVVGVPYERILDDFERSRTTAEAELPAEGETSDVKYHRGADGVYETAAGPVRVRISPNPSHLEAVDPIVEGCARAEQTDRSGNQLGLDQSCVVPVLIHGDAAFAAQGVVAETLNLARLPGYSTGGTIHLIANNQLGFTVEPSQARSTDWASDLAKGFDVPILHVNADDPEACLDAVRLALAYRETFHGDVVIDVVGYRRHGHNEEDEPAYTQPGMYERIARQPTARQRYLARLVEEGVLDEAAGEAMLGDAERHLAEVRESLEPAGQRRRREAHASRSRGAPPRTAVAADRLRSIEAGLLSWPEDFSVHPKLARQLERRRAGLEADGRIGWAQAEALAFGALLLDGVPIRLTGQDTERGTFSQRHLVLHDARDGRAYTPLAHLAGAKAPLELHNSPLSEYACLGFEYGYAVAAPEALVLWEAQYGDFANGAEIVIDQFIIAGLAKWGQTSRLTLLLPHGYEGQGPEHSSARLERYLALGAEGNIRVADCTTPAQYFHLLRDQARRSTARPLVLMTPKSLLRLPAATSSLDELARGGFRAVLDDTGRAAAADAVSRLVLCSGRVYYDLLASPRRASSPDVAIGRLELLYPFPADEIRELLATYPNLRSVAWVQEEPSNMGARKFVLPQLQELLPAGVALDSVARPERSSPAEGYHAAHRAEQARVVEGAFGGRTDRAGRAGGADRQDRGERDAAAGGD